MLFTILGLCEMYHHPVNDRIMVSHIYFRAGLKEMDILGKREAHPRESGSAVVRRETPMIYISGMCKPLHWRWGDGCKDGDGV